MFQSHNQKGHTWGELTGHMILTASKATHFKKEEQEGTAWEIYQGIMYPGLKKVDMKNIYETIEYGLNIWWY